MSTLIPEVAIAVDVFDCLIKLPKSSQQQAKKFITRFRKDPRSAAINFERIKNAKDANMRSVRINQNLRGIVLAPEQGSVYLLLWIDNHDDAYRWATNHKAGVNAASGSVQVYSVEEILVKGLSSKPEKGLFDDLQDEQLLRLRIPQEQIFIVRAIKTVEDLEISEKLFPPDAFDSLYLYASGSSFEEVMSELAIKDEDSTVSSDDFATALQTDESRRKYWVVDNDEELQRMLDAPLEKWRVYLHPSQRRLVERHWNGPVCVIGAAGTGKTVATLHRTRWLVENWLTKQSERILYTTFSTNLAADVEENLKSICSQKQLEQIEVVNLDKWVADFLKSRRVGRRVVFSSDNKRHDIWTKAIGNYGTRLGISDNFFRDEWHSVVQANSLTTMEEYLGIPRVGRGARLDKKTRAEIWNVFKAYRELLKKAELLEPDDSYRLVEKIINRDPFKLPYKAVVVDEAQDLSPVAFRMIRALVPVFNKETNNKAGFIQKLGGFLGPETKKGTDRNSLFIAGDGHQRIYGRRIVLGRCGINIRGRSRKLRVNYRTSEEIRKWALAVLEGIDIDDLDDGRDDEMGYRSLYHGPIPELKHFKDSKLEINGLTEWIKQLQAENLSLKDICIIARTNRILQKVEEHLQKQGLKSVTIQRRQAENRRIPGVRLATMHRSKGLEFVAAAIVAVNKDIIPSKKALGAAPDQLSREEVMVAERMLIYVAATRAKKRLLVTSSGEPSPFISKFQSLDKSP